MLSEHFIKEEFRCPCGKCPELLPSGILITKLEEVRGFIRQPITITSGIRCKEHNKNVKGKRNSTHIYGYAVDISISNSAQRFMITLAAMSMGIRRIGIGDSFIHLDVAPEPDWPQDVMWVY